MSLFKRILIANRGEIACRIARTCRELQVEYVCVYSDADKTSPHLEGAVMSVHLGGVSASSSYLNIDKMVTAALQSGCDAVHPGYGFLSENAAFAAAVRSVGLVFIGPLVDTIAKMGDKSQAKALMRAAGVPLVPGADESSDDPMNIDELAKLAGYPVLLKPVAGGGGKGMIVVKSPDQLAASAQSAMRVAKMNFGDPRLLVERYIPQPRHIEVQIFGDHHGNVVHLYERECSLQRRHQKIIEEAPPVNLDDATLAALREAAVTGARAIGYQNAGTFEFIVAPTGEFFFLEVNTRLQVEHPVTELITGIDLVEWQLLVASGHPIPLKQQDISVRGHAIECRVYAEDPCKDFAPSPGGLTAVVWPDIRVDSGVVSGSQVSPYYDPMVAKLVAHGTNRSAALERMHQALKHTVLLGVSTNLNFLDALITDQDVVQGCFSTHLVDEKMTSLIRNKDSQMALACAAAYHLVDCRAKHKDAPWLQFGWGPRGVLDRHGLDAAAPMGCLSVFDLDSQVREAFILDARHDQVWVQVAERVHEIKTEGWHGNCLTGTVGADSNWAAKSMSCGIEVLLDGNYYRFSAVRNADQFEAVAEGALVAAMPGVLVALHVQEGSVVKQGDQLAVIEAMKMEHTILANSAGMVVDLKVEVGDRVDQGTVILEISNESNELQKLTED